jgi:hypothetical protein
MAARGRVRGDGYEGNRIQAESGALQVLEEDV